MFLPDNCNFPEDNICKLEKSIHGLKSVPKCWYEKFNIFIYVAPGLY